MRTRRRPPATAIDRLPPGACVASFVVYGRARPWTPSRVTSRGTYKPKAVRQWQRVVADTAAVAVLTAEHTPYAGPVRLALAFEFIKGPLPDWDNATKAVADALQGVVIVNDRQVEEASVTRRLGEIDRVSVRVEAI